MLEELITLVILLSVFIFTVFLLHWYPAPKTPPVVYIFVFLGWFNSFVIVTLIPYDISGTHSRSTYSLTSVWMVLYWSIFVVCWVILPVMNSFYRSGEFTTSLRIKDALKTEATFVVVIGSAFAVFVIYLLIIGQMTIGSLPEIFVLLSNLWGLLLLVVLLGFGLVSVPVGLWKKGSLKKSLEILQIKLANLEYKKSDITKRIHQKVYILKMLEKVAKNDEPVLQLASIILSSIPDRFNQAEESEEKVPLNRKEIVRLHKSLKNLLFEFNRTEWYI